MANTIDQIKIAGLRDFQKALKDMDGESQKKLRLVLNQAADVVVDRARPLIPHDGGTAKASLKAQSSQREVRVKAGGAKASYYPWLDFGGSVGRGHIPRKAGSGAIKRPFRSKGRYIYPSYEKSRNQVHDALVEGLANLAQEAGLEVT